MNKIRLRVYSEFVFDVSNIIYVFENYVKTKTLLLMIGEDHLMRNEKIFARRMRKRFGGIG